MFHNKQEEKTEKLQLDLLRWFSWKIPFLLSLLKISFSVEGGKALNEHRRLQQYNGKTKESSDADFKGQRNLVNENSLIFNTTFTACIPSKGMLLVKSKKLKRD